MKSNSTDMSGAQTPENPLTSDAPYVDHEDRGPYETPEEEQVYIQYERAQDGLPNDLAEAREELREEFPDEDDIEDIPPVNTGQKSPQVIAAIICGIISIILAFLSPLFAVILGIVAIGLATSFIRRHEKTAQAVIARYLGIAGIVLAVAVYVTMVSLLLAAYNNLPL